MNVERSVIEAKLKAACSQFMSKDAKLLDLDSSERSMAHKLAEHLQVQFPEWDVDCEYNRDQYDPKKVSFSDCLHGKADARKVFPDIVIHQRGNKCNLVAIEAKKSTSRDADHDKCKLEAYLTSLGYQYAFKVIFPVGSRDQQEIPVEEFKA